METYDLPQGYTHDPNDTLADRNIFTYAKDKVIDIGAKGAVSLAQVPPNILADVTSDPKERAGYKRAVEQGEAIKTLLDNFKSDKGRQLEEPGRDDRGYFQKLAESIATPETAITMASGAAAPLVGSALFGAKGYSDLRTEHRKEVKALTPEQIESFRAPGETDADVVERLDQEGIRGAAIGGGAQFVAGGVLGAASKPVAALFRGPKAAARQDATSMVDRILARVGGGSGSSTGPMTWGQVGKAYGVATAETAALGAVQGAGSEFGRQTSAFDAGMRPGFDFEQIGHAAREGAELMAPFGVVGKAASLYGQRRARIAADRKAAADQLNVDKTIVAGEQLNHEQPRTRWDDLGDWVKDQTEKNPGIHGPEGPFSPLEGPGGPLPTPQPAPPTAPPTAPAARRARREKTPTWPETQPPR